MGFLLTLLLLLIVSSIISVLYLFCTAWLRTRRIRREFRRQGIEGPPPSFPFGNLPEMKKMMSAAAETTTTNQEEYSSMIFEDYSKKLFPYFHRWRKLYGPTYVYWIRGRAAVYTSDPDLIREISLCVSLDLGKPKQLQKSQEPLFGQGILKSNGVVWAHQRKVLAPAFFMDKIKGMLDAMNKSAIPLLSSWEGTIDREGGIAEIVVNEDFRVFSADVISRVCFGSDYLRGKEIFVKLRDLAKQMSKSDLLFDNIPYSRFLPTKRNRMIRALELEIRSLILDIVEEQKEKSSTTMLEKDLLRSILQSDITSGANSKWSSEFVVDNCKNIYFAGHETAAVTATWCLMLLAKNPAWQARARAEVVEVCRGRQPDFQMIRKMKTLTMIIHETMRLFPPSSFVARETFADVKFRNLRIGKGTSIWIPISTMHQEQATWGPDAAAFNPERFARGIARACEHPHAYMPFGIGARTCIGQNLAMVELKVILSLILSKFTFSLSASYRHSPCFRLIIEPEFGLPLIVRRV